MAEGVKRVADLPSSEDGLEIEFGQHTVGWYRHAAWFAQQIHESGVLPGHVRTSQQAFAILCKGDELGLPPFAAWGWIYPTKAGRLAIQTKGALAVVQSKLTYEDYEERIENEGTPEMRAVAIATRKGKKPVIKEFTLKDAEVAGLLRERRTREGERYDSTYQSFLKDMLLARARGRALEQAFAAELGGIPIEGIAEDADMMEERRSPPERKALAAAAPPRRDPLLAAVGRKQLAAAGVGAPADPPPPDVTELDPSAVKVIESQVDEIFGPPGPKGGPLPAAQPEAPKPAAAQPDGHEGRATGGSSTTPAGDRRGPGRVESSPGGDTGRREAGREVTPHPAGSPVSCQRCKTKLNALGGCDACGWPGDDIR